MLDLKFVRENIDLVNQNSQNKNESASASEITSLDESRRLIIQESEALKNQRNIVSKEIANLKAQKLDAEEKIVAMKTVSDKIKLLDDELRTIDDAIQKVLIKLPNIVHETVPVGKNEEANLVVRSWGEVLDKPNHKTHMEIAKELNIIDFERAAKVSGTGFAFYVGKGAKLERAIINFFLETHLEKHNYTELMPPFIVNRNSMVGTGQLPKMAEDMYHCTEDDMFLIPTAEVPLTNFHNGEMLNFDEFPIKYCGYSPCFRREAGSYGKDTRGFLRVHQFNKVELVNFTAPEKSYEQLEILVGEVENVLQLLKLPYRVLLLCTGDTSFSSAKTYDLEVWAEGEKKWLEVSSCSNFADFQARRASIRFKRKGDTKPEFVHTLNGSGLATSRIMVAIIENYYKDGKLEIPEVLRQYCGFDFIKSE